MSSRQGQSDSGQGQIDCITRKTTSTVKPTTGRAIARASQSKDPALSTETGGSAAATAESASVGNVHHKPHSPKEKKVSFCWRNVSRVPFVDVQGELLLVDDGVAYFMNHEWSIACSYNPKLARNGVSFLNIPIKTVAV